jgi:hypothetical protein
LNVEKLLIDVFDPQPGEVAAVMVDLPHGRIEDTECWKKRRQMAERWRIVLSELGAKREFRVQPMLSFPATGAHNADLPERGNLGPEEVPLRETLRASTLVVAMTEFSATAPLALLAGESDDFRAASMPGVEERMEATALAADYARVARRCRGVAEVMRGAVLCDVMFSTGHRCWFDLRHREPRVDDGSLPRFKKGIRLINLPSGEAYVVPYEGEVEGAPSWTAGTIPVVEDGELVLFHLARNRVQLVEGEGPAAKRYRDCFAHDPARANVAEVAFGLNDRAAVTGNGLEDEKAGFHWAYGRSDHLGGVVGVQQFRSPETVVHQDLIYAHGNPVQVTQAALRHPDGRCVAVILGGQYQF